MNKLKLFLGAAIMIVLGGFVPGDSYVAGGICLMWIGIASNYDNS